MASEQFATAVPVPRRSDKRQVLDLMEQYKKVGKFQMVLDAINGEISANTLNNWMKNKDAAEKAYKSDALLRIKQKLPSLEDQKKYDAFSFALDEFGLERNSQVELKGYHGIYNIHHHLRAENVEKLTISAKSAPAFATFWFRYRSSGKGGVCDGLVVMRRSRLYLVGLARGSMFTGHVRAVADPRHDMLKGFAVYEDFNSEIVSGSNIVLVSQDHVLSAEEKAVIDEYISKDIFAAT